MRRVLSRYGPTRIASRLASGRRAVESLASLAGLVVDVVLPDGSGLEVAELARERFAEALILVLTGHNSPKTNRRAFELGAGYLQKPASSGDIELFARRAMTLQVARTQGLQDAVDRFSGRHGMSRRERRIVELLVSGVSARSHLAAQLGVTEHTAKKQIASILAKSGARRAADVVRLVLATPFADAEAARSTASREPSSGSNR